MATKWNPSNINLFGTKLLQILFTGQELKNGRIEQPHLDDLPSLDLKRLNILKGKLKSSLFILRIRF